MATDKKQDATDLLQKQMDDANDKGYLGDKVDPLPNSAHSLESGPDAPSPASQYADALQQRADEAKAETKEEN